MRQMFASVFREGVLDKRSPKTMRDSSVVAGSGPTEGAGLQPARPDWRPRVGVVGCGYWGSKHVRVVSGLASVSSVVAIDRDEALCRKLKTVFPAVEMFACLEDALPALDAVIVATPPESHAAVAALALRAGKHVLVEKPLATTLDEARDVVRIARESDRLLMVGHTFNPLFPI